MPLFLVCLALLFVIQGALTSDCYTYLIGSTPQSYTCLSSGYFSASDFDRKQSFEKPFNNFQVQGSNKKLSVSFTIVPLSGCSAIAPLNLLTLSILPQSTNGVRKRVMQFVYDGSSILWKSEDTLGTQTLMNVPVSSVSFLNQPYNFFMSVNLMTGSYGLTGGGVVENSARISSLTSPATPTYGSDWTFDSTLQIHLCSDYDGSTNSLACLVQNLKVRSYFYTTILSVMDFTNQVTMLADYQLNEGSGTWTSNSQGTLAFATFSSPPPAWVPNGGLSFTSASQYIQLPNFMPSDSDLTVTASLGFTFYIKIDAAPATTSNIISYYSAPKSGNIFQLLITPGLALQLGLDGTLSTVSSTSLPLGHWIMIYVSYTYTFGGYGAANFYIDGTYVAPSLATNTAYGASGNTVFSTSDYVQFGLGFLGQLRRLQVYSPAAFRLNTAPCNPTTCAFDIGFSTPPTCLQPVCSSGFFQEFGNCESCSTGCLVCSDPTTCTSCGSKYYLSGAACSQCPVHCSSCVSSTACQSCDTGYGLYGNLCMLCPSGTYLSSSDQICKEFSQTIQDTMKTSQLLNSAATQASSIVSKGRGISLSAAISGKIFSQIKYLNISYSGELKVALLTWMTSFVSLGLTPNLPESIIDEIPDRSVPYVFEKYDVPSSFLINFWEDLGVVVFVTVTWLLLKGAECLVSSRENPRIASFARKIRVIAQNFLVTALYGVYGDLIMYSIIEYRTLVFGWNLSLLSFIISVILLITMSISFWYQTKLLITYQKLKKQDSNTLLKEFTKKHEGSQVLFKDFKDYSLAPQLFIFFLSGRDLLFSLLLATMFEHPLAQTLIITILDCLMIAYLLIKRPFQSSFDAAQQMFFEITSLVVTVAVCINAILDAGKYESMGTRVNIGKLLIVANMIFNFVTASFMIVSIVQMLKEFIQGVKEKRAKKVEALRIKNRLREFPLNETSLNKNLDSSMNFLHGKNHSQSFETSPHENSDLSFSSHQTKTPNLLLKSQQARYPMNRESIPKPLPRRINFPANGTKLSKSRSPLQRNFRQFQGSQERKQLHMDSFQNPRLHQSPDRSCLKQKNRFPINPQ